MIESRYKIEYVLPDEEIKKPSSYRVIWYLFLIPIIFILVAAITYDFSIKDISRDSSTLLETVKTEVFNLNSKPQHKNESAQSKAITKTSDTPSTSKNTNNLDKDKITELTKKQELQLKEIQEQMAANKQQVLNLNKLSEELALEQSKNQKLNSKLAAQEKDRLELEQQLNRIAEESAITKTKLDNLNKLQKEKEIALQNQTIKNKAPLNTTVKVIGTTNQSAIKSETDEIIETMLTSAPNADKNNKTADTVKSTIENKETVSNNEIEKNETAAPITIPTSIKKVDQITMVESNVSEGTKKTTNTNSLIEPKSSTETTEKKSEIDNIIATMQEDKSNSVNNDKNNVNQKDKLTTN